MERNLHFEIAGLADIAVRLAWAQMEVFADDVDKIQVLAAGDEGTVQDLRIGIKGDALVVEQPQYGLSLNITESRWMQLCIRVPRTWTQDIHLNTISGLLSARGLKGSHIVLDTISGDLQATRLAAQEITLKTISGDIRGDKLEAKTLLVRSVSGDQRMDEVEAENVKANSINGEQNYHFVKAFWQVDANTVSGNVTLSAPMEKAQISMRSISGRVRTEGVTVVEEGDAPKVNITGISSELKLIAIS